jgi:hypothetical protein
VRRQLPEGSRRLTFWETAPPRVRVEVCIEVNAHEMPQDLDAETVAFEWSGKLKKPVRALCAGWSEWARERNAPKPN